MVRATTATQPRRGRDLRQPVDPALRHRPALCRRAPARGVPQPLCRKVRRDAAAPCTWSTASSSSKAAGSRRAMPSWSTRPCWPTDIDPSHLQAARRPTVGTGPRAPRPDIADKVFGEFEYINDMVLPGMCFGQVFRPKTLQARSGPGGAAAAVERAVGTGRRHQGGPRRHARRRAGRIGISRCPRPRRRSIRKRLWRGAADVPSPADSPAWLKSQPLDTTVIVDQQPQATAAGAASASSAPTFERQYLQHASIGLSCADRPVDETGRCRSGATARASST